MNKILSISLMAVSLWSCGAKDSKTVAKNKEGDTITPLHNSGADSVLKSTLERIKGNWVDGKTVITFYDSLYVTRFGNSIDSSFYSISYKSCEPENTSEKVSEDILYLNTISKDGDKACLSIDNLTDEKLSLMTLANGSVWVLSRQ